MAKAYRARARQVGRKVGGVVRARRAPGVGGDGRLVSFDAPSRQSRGRLHRGLRRRRSRASRPRGSACADRGRAIAARRAVPRRAGTDAERRSATRRSPRSPAWSARSCSREPWTMRSCRRTSSRPCGSRSPPSIPSPPRTRATSTWWPRSRRSPSSGEVNCRRSNPVSDGSRHEGVSAVRQVRQRTGGSPRRGRKPPQGGGPVRRRSQPARAGAHAVPALALCARAHSRHRRESGGRDAGRGFHRDGSRPRARRREASPFVRRLPACRWRTDGGAAAACARRRHRALRRRSGRRRGRRDARCGARRDGSHRRPLRRVAERRRRQRRGGAWRAAGVARGYGKHRRGDPPWRRCRGHEGLRRRRTRGHARHRQPAAGALSHRAPRAHRELRHRERSHHAPRHQPDADRPARRPVRRGARHSARQGAGARGRRRRRLRDEDGAVPRGRRDGVLHARTEAAAQVVRRPHRRVPGGLARSRRDQQGRAGAGRVRPGAGAPRGHARQPGRVCDACRRRDPAAHRTVGVDEHLRHHDDRRRDQGCPHAHEPDGRLPRRRTARGDLPHRAADGRRGAQARHGSGRAAPAQHDPAAADAVQESDGQDVRQRQLRVGAGSGAVVRRLEGIRRAARAVGAAPASCADAAWRPFSNGPAPTCSRSR